MNLPVRLSKNDQRELEILWNDDFLQRIPVRLLRAACPCATCREKASSESSKPEAASLSLPVISAAEARPLEILSMKPVGHYAYQIRFSDGHSSGLFTLELLREIGPPSR